MQQVNARPPIYVGNDSDAIQVLNSPNMQEYYILHAAKEPYHRRFVGYTSRGCPKDSPEYLVARRGNQLALNMVDAPKGKFFSMEMICAGLNFIDEGIENHRTIFIHCNKGESRSPSLAMLYLYKRLLKDDCTLDEAIEKFKQIYPPYNPAKGILEHLTDFWDKYNL